MSRVRFFLRHVNRIFDELEEAKAELRQSCQQKQHISMATVSSAQWVDLISAFTQEYPGTPISCTSLKFSHLADGGLPAEFTFLFASEDALPESYAAQMHKIRFYKTEVKRENAPAIKLYTSVGSTIKNEITTIVHTNTGQHTVEQYDIEMEITC